MTLRSPLLGLSTAALVLGLAWPSGEGESVGEIAIELYDLGGPPIGAREPALLMPGPRLRWTSPHGPRGMALGSGGWVEEELADSDLWWASGRLVVDVLPTEATPMDTALAAFDAASFRNGVSVGVDGRRQGWGPQVGWDADGGAHMVFDRFVDGSHDIYYRSPSGTETAVASTPAFEAHASIAIDAMERIWIAWDEGASNWGGNAGLHETRRMRLIVRQGADRDWQEVTLPDNPDLIASGLSSVPTYDGFAELPHLIADDDGTLWLLYRTMQVHPVGNKPTASLKVAWVIRAIALGAEGWSEPRTLPHSDGPNHDTLAAIDTPGPGILAAWTGDHRLDRFASLRVWGEPVMEEARLQVARLQHDRAPMQETIPGLTERGNTPDATTRGLPFTSDPDPALGPDGHLRLWGDLHRHSDLSRCNMDSDGSVPDQYRYAAAVGLDFVAVTDHHQHLTPTAWRFLLDTTDRFREPGEFIPMFGFERALRHGHRNLITPSRSAAAAAPFLDRQEVDLSVFPADDFLAIPHQMANANSIFRWRRHLPAIENQLEIYQRRGSYEEEGAFRMARGTGAGAKYTLDHLRDGKRFGLIASSDHSLENGAFAVIYAKERTRESIFEALKARRSYAATAKIALDVRLGERLMGEEGTVAADSALQVRCDTGATGGGIARVEVVRNGEVAHRWDGSATLPNVGLLTIRFGNLPGRPPLPLRGEGMEFQTGRLLDGEAGAATSTAEEWSDTIELLYASTRDQFLGGWTLPVRLTEDHPTLTFGEGDAALTFALAELQAGSEWQKRYRDRPISIHLGSAALGASRLDESWTPGDWQPGDWVYVRVIRNDGAMAWSSPIWVD